MKHAVGVISCRQPTLWLAMALAATGGCAHFTRPEPAPWWAELPEQAAIETRLAAAGTARGEIERFLAEVPVEARADAAFLAANLPRRDLGAISADLLLENVDYARRAMAAAAWADDVPPFIFRHYVLPYRVSQEPLSRSRPALFAALAGEVAQCPNLAEAALAVNRWCDEHSRFVQTEFRDQTSIDTLRSGYGRCEELTILFLSAARAAGVPARTCSTPWWAAADNNHAWAEVWDGESFRYLGAAEAGGGLNEAWFSGPARRAAAVYSIQFGRGDPAPEPLYREIESAAVVNSTAVYTRPGRLRVNLADAAGRSWPETWVRASVFNWGAFRAIAEQRTDDAGTVELTLGAGEYLVSGGDDESGAARIVRVERDQMIIIDLIAESPPPAPEGHFLLHIPDAEENPEVTP